jgi:hypothetical protein
LNREGRLDLFGAAIVAALIAFALAFGAQRGRRTLAVVARTGDTTALAGVTAKFQLFPTQGRIEVAAKDGRSQAEIEMSLVVDGIERPLVMRRGDVHVKDKNTLVGDFPIELGEERATGSLELRMDPLSDLLTAGLAISHEAGSSDHTYALRFGLAPEGRSVFVPGNGEIGDTANIQARTVVVDDETHPFAFLSSQGPLSIVETAPDTDQPGARPRLVLSSRTETAMRRAPGTAPGKPARLDIGVLVGASSQAVWGRLYSLLKVQVGRVNGQVTGSSERAHVIGLDEEGHPMLRTVVDPNGRFVLEAPTTAVQWIAALEAVHTSLPVRFTPGLPWELKLDVSAGGELAVKIIDADTGQPLVARLIVKGVDGTLDPSFGPDYRASGAGPLMDVLEGEVKTPLPSGRYRVAATRGIEWSIDAQTVEIASGRTKQIELAPRHVLATPGVVSCDLHVHARPSFDSPVTTEDRVLSLVAAGIDFAVPTEHNMIGDYSPFLDVLKLNKQLATVTGVEVTTYNPRFGHFGVFPYAASAGVPPFKGTSIGAVISASKRGNPDRVFQVNHPRLPQNIGFFNIINYDSKTGRGASGIPQFDTLEVYNGYELHRRELTDHVIEDWYSLLNAGRHLPATGSSDSHRIQYQWAGYPRTFVAMDPRAAGDGGGPIDVKEVVSAIKKGHGFVSSGPILDFEIVEAGRKALPGDELPHHGAVNAHVKVRAAPWVDVTSVEIIGGTTPPTPGTHGMNAAAVVSLWKQSVPTHPLQLGKEEGTLEEAQQRTVRFDADVPIKIPDGSHWVIAIVRGERAMDDALPFMPIQPLAFSNPIYVAH